MAPEDALEVEVVYALPDEQVLVKLAVTPGTTVGQVLERALAGRPAAVALADAPVGIHGRRVRRDTLISAGDRVEIYRPLIADPGQVRRRRAARRP